MELNQVIFIYVHADNSNSPYNKSKQKQDKNCK